MFVFIWNDEAVQGIKHLLLDRSSTHYCLRLKRKKKKHLCEALMQPIPNQIQSRVAPTRANFTDYQRRNCNRPHIRGSASNNDHYNYTLSSRISPTGVCSRAIIAPCTSRSVMRVHSPADSAPNIELDQGFAPNGFADGSPIHRACALFGITA